MSVVRTSAPIMFDNKTERVAIASQSFTGTANIFGARVSFCRDPYRCIFHDKLTIVLIWSNGQLYRSG